jgi:hypothetical protein
MLSHPDQLSLSSCRSMLTANGVFDEMYSNVSRLSPARMHAASMCACCSLVCAINPVSAVMQPHSTLPMCALCLRSTTCLKVSSQSSSTNAVSTALYVTMHGMHQVFLLLNLHCIRSSRQTPLSSSHLPRQPQRHVLALQGIVGIPTTPA